MTARRSLSQAKEEIEVLRRNQDEAISAIRNAEDESVIRYLIEEEALDVTHDGPRGLGKVRREVLKSDVGVDLKRLVSYRGDDTPSEILVPDEVLNNSIVALKTGKPVVLYGPTGTGKTTFAKQLAQETCEGYTLNTATPSWTPSDIIGGISPETTGRQLRYHRKLGCVSEAVQRAEDFSVNYGVIIDEITRADISKIFGPLYTAIENPHQTIFETDDGDTIELDERVNIICTMNMSDRTVNELDNAITRRFAMIEIEEYSEANRARLFRSWLNQFVSELPDVDIDQLQAVFEVDYQGINYGHEETSQGPIMQFGPMHYRDVAAFVGAACHDDEPYAGQVGVALGQAFKTYIVPRLLNAAALPQLDRIIDHYKTLDNQFDAVEFSPAVKLAEDQLASERRQMGR
ncbi:ATPase [Haloferax sp. Atlit-4N]|uniref:AAA family ATPase n=1 Tax=Haloferax sp. Atlit-4N TaxID=2077206 RepID=UPI000E21D0E5|nr:AAA family ATPase [Haloferax sp. Atlit-4N]RDZ50442.1 ATPase [Haloferax sp. Atlit-4N]